MIFTNTRLVFPDGVRDGLEVVCSGGRIVEIRSADEGVVREGIDLEGNYLAPGFVDLHLHGAVGRDTMEGTPEAFRAICDYHASGGTTSLLLTTATAPLPRILEVLRAVRSSMPEVKQIRGVHVEGPFLSPQRAGAQSVEFLREPDAEAVGELLEYSDVIRRVTLAPELPGALAAIEQFAAHGIAVSGGHSDAWDEEAQVAFERGMRHVTHTFNCMSSARRRGAERVAGLLEFALSEPEIVCELIADGRHVSPTLMRMLYRAKGAGGICLVTDATAGAGLPEGSEFQLAGRACVTEQGACWLADRSALAGSAARMIDLVRVMVREVGVPLHEAVMMATLNPARALGSGTKGRIAAGADADFVVFSPALEVRQTFVGGERVFATLRRGGSARRRGTRRDG
ncbi:MAG: N-acetylglucosamine-6-phosphate deacetylase [Chthoniobacterales bacterium]|nr:N-acetylglucosamine-6-phosphate deacetylase [Chthoniobacterales bacterium]